MPTKLSRYKQSIFDIVLESFGNLDNIIRVANDNNLIISDQLNANTELIINNENLGDKRIKEIISNDGLQFNNDGDAVNFLTVDGDTITVDNTIITVDTNDESEVSDISFFIGTGLNNTVYVIEMQTDDKILVGGDFTTYNGTSAVRLVRLDSDGSLDATLVTGTGFNNDIKTIEYQTDTKILVGGDFTTYNGTSINRIIRLDSDGSIDATFLANVGTSSNGRITKILAQPDGKILLVGAFSNFNGTSINRIVRLNSDGTIDASFVANVGTGANSPIYDMALQSDGKIIICGLFSSFDGNAALRIARLDSDGSFDATFNIGSGFDSDFPTTIAIDSSDNIWIGGTLTSYNGNSRGRIVKLNSDGTDTNEVTVGFNDYLGNIKIQPDGKILVVGNILTYNGTSINKIARLNSDGSLDTSLQTTGTGINDGFTIVCDIQSDGKIIVGGTLTGYNGTTLNRIIRLNADGSNDTTN